MTIKEAVGALSIQLRNAPWFTAVGIEEFDQIPCIVLYVKSFTKADFSFLKDSCWQGFHVDVRKMGSIRPAVF